MIGTSSDQMTAGFNNPLLKYSDAQEQRVANIMESVINRPDQRPLLVIDDGAYFARYLKSLQQHSTKKLKAFIGTSVVEQTTRGHRYLCNNALEVIHDCDLSVVSIAKCNSKIRFEGPFIGTAVSKAVIHNISDEHFKTSRNIAIIGFGTVGAATACEIVHLAPHTEIDIVDVDPAKREKASTLSNKCKGVPQLNDNKHYDIVIGCTGYNSFHLDQRKLLSDNAVLASGSSAAIEFNRSGFIELADEFPDDEIEVLYRSETLSQGLHSPITLRQEGGKTFQFLNAGFPVNFDGALEHLPTILIQPTHCLLFAAALQSLRQKGSGINTIDPSIDDWIFDQSIQHLANCQTLNQ